MLFRTLAEIEQNISDFLVYEKRDEIIGICSLKFGWDRLVEIRSLGVTRVISGWESPPKWFRVVLSALY